eukprot:scaffold3961_cov222-Pinguiococcus_pyrenoidosus.AAC.2
MAVACSRYMGGRWSAAEHFWGSFCCSGLLRRRFPALPRGCGGATGRDRDADSGDEATEAPDAVSGRLRSPDWWLLRSDAVAEIESGDCCLPGCRSSRSSGLLRAGDATGRDRVDDVDDEATEVPDAFCGRPRTPERRLPRSDAEDDVERLERWLCASAAATCPAPGSAVGRLEVIFRRFGNIELFINWRLHKGIVFHGDVRLGLCWRRRHRVVFWGGGNGSQGVCDLLFVHGVSRHSLFRDRHQRFRLLLAGNRFFFLEPGVVSDRIFGLDVIVDAVAPQGGFDVPFENHLGNTPFVVLDGLNDDRVVSAAGVGRHRAAARSFHRLQVFVDVGKQGARHALPRLSLQLLALPERVHLLESGVGDRLQAVAGERVVALLAEGLLQTVAFIGWCQQGLDLLALPPEILASGLGVGVAPGDVGGVVPLDKERGVFPGRLLRGRLAASCKGLQGDGGRRRTVR